ncbi:MAG: TolC family protein [Planctomycetota bacterium]
MSRISPLRRTLLAAALLALPLGSGCRSSAAYAKNADEEVYALLENVITKVTGERKVFEIGERPGTLRQRILQGDVEQPIRIDLQTALDIAAENSRQFKTAKETLYRSALGLSAVIDSFEIQYVGTTGFDVNGVGDDATSFDTSAVLSESLATTSGQTIVASFVNTFFRSLLTGGAESSSSVLSIGFSTPLFRSFGRRIAREPLTQSERNLVYAVRNFERTRRELAFSVFATFLNLLNQQRNLEAVRKNLESLQKNAARATAEFDAEILDLNSLGRAQQSVLSAENSLINSIQGLQSSLDAFKFTLGLPIGTEIELDDSVLDGLSLLGVTEIPIEQHDAVRLAWDRRFDLRTARDQIADARRGVLIADDALQSFLTFDGGIAVPSDPDQPVALDFSEIAWDVGLDLDLDLERTAERNNYRDSLIDLDQAERSVEALEDNIAQEIRDELRTTKRSIANYRIQEQAVALAERRVDATTQLFETGRVNQNDVLDAQNDLLNAELSLNNALITYFTDRFELILDLEGLVIEPRGLRVDLSLPLPEGPMQTPDGLGAPRDSADR